MQCTLNFLAGFATSTLDIVVINISWNVTIMEETTNTGESGGLMPRLLRSNQFAVSNSSGSKVPNFLKHETLLSTLEFYVLPRHCFQMLAAKIYNKCHLKKKKKEKALETESTTTHKSLLWLTFQRQS